ncbi:hypothetical protein NMY22_g3047 [Coprinellus aureogranulatus]|nr:hypothetical protein NMY22_g3047 [Coprinellus aureogranulatus]
MAQSHRIFCRTPDSPAGPSSQVLSHDAAIKRISPKPSLAERGYNETILPPCYFTAILSNLFTPGNDPLNPVLSERSSIELPTSYFAPLPQFYSTVSSSSTAVLAHCVPPGKVSVKPSLRIWFHGTVDLAPVLQYNDCSTSNLLNYIPARNAFMKPLFSNHNSLELSTPRLLHILQFDGAVNITFAVLVAVLQNVRGRFASPRQLSQPIPPDHRIGNFMVGRLPGSSRQKAATTHSMSTVDTACLAYSNDILPTHETTRDDTLPKYSIMDIGRGMSDCATVAPHVGSPLSAKVRVPDEVPVQLEHLQGEEFEHRATLRVEAQLLQHQTFNRCLIAMSHSPSALSRHVTPTTFLVSDAVLVHFSLFCSRTDGYRRRAVQIPADSSTPVEPPFLLTLSNASLAVVVADPDSRSTLELGYGIGPHGEFPRTWITLAAFFKDRCDSGMLNINLRPGERYLLAVKGPNAIDVIGQFPHLLHGEPYHTEREGLGVPQGNIEGNGDDGRGATGNPGKATETEVSQRDTVKKQAVNLESTDGTRKRRGRPTNAERDARKAEEERRVEEAARQARKEEEKAERRQATRSTRDNGGFPQENLAFGDGFAYQVPGSSGAHGPQNYGDLFSARSGVNQYGDLPQRGSGPHQHGDFPQGGPGPYQYRGIPQGGSGPHHYGDFPQRGPGVPGAQPFGGFPQRGLGVEQYGDLAYRSSEGQHRGDFPQGATQYYPHALRRSSPQGREKTSNGI